MSLPIPPPAKGSAPDNLTGTWFTGNEVDAVSAAFDAGMSDKRAKTVERVGERLAAMRAKRRRPSPRRIARRLTLVPRVDTRGITCHARVADERRPRERREQRHTARTTSSSDPGDEGPAAPDLIRGGACTHCAAPLHTDRNGADHCGGCGITWWEGV